ncbi:MULTISPECIES: GcrA family cell cycle regulator [unclassified Phenylobacterium]|uniref:GcrA family cell cycle regulator n=1 Tax=unclassified Phenylobacterium TaxID=2640670 RepID=UPI00083B49DE|nr:MULTISPECIES: GcrA family cell cycle regulator [unclassified Phenylobacterium]OHB31193.1 MAG: hypothetical protein A2790_10670 [Phenylobacterium sp. RIFCSPHIGHO2_01_FULL_69_31]
MTQFPTWSDDRVTTLKTLWLEGLSAAQIARRLGGVTRNAVIGKVHRLGLSGRATASRPGRTPRGRTPRRPRPAKMATVTRPQVRASAPAVAAVPEGPGLIADLTGLRAHMCKWPIGDPKAADFSFCGRPADGPYCPTHAAAGVRPGSSWRADGDPIVRRALAGLV